MVDLTREMADLMEALKGGARAADSGRGRVILFAAACGGEGVSTVVREYARCEAAFARRPVWLIDADLRQQTQLEAVLDEPARFGPPGPVSSATPDGSVFFALEPKALDAQGQPVPDSQYLIARSFLDKRLWVTRLRDHLLLPGQKTRLFEQSSYWQALRTHAQAILVDAPAFDRSDAVLRLAPLVDGVVLVVSEGEGEIDARVALKTQIEQAGGRLLGMVYNKSRATVPLAGRKSAHG
ncbi:transcriptional regulator [Asticcacaulis sp.]|jgi:Mrp family chromosome partitioning ATPase|uniref:transcriptional regulator n=1 Tax=Asticcacaulis sp. TaxID=1872648 RepID=UPI0031D332A6